GQEAEVFAYGGPTHPLDLKRGRGEDEEDAAERRGPGWVNLSDYRWQEEGGRSRCENAGQQLFALFDRQQAAVGDRLRLLVYVPFERGRLLFTAEGRTVLDYHITWTPRGKGPYHVVELPIKQRYFPSFYLQGRVVAGEGRAGTPAPRRLRDLAKRLREDDEE